MTAPSPERPSEADLVAYMERLRDLELDGASQEVAFGPYTAMLMISFLQLAARHPALDDRQLDVIGSLIEQFRPWFAGTPGEHIIEMGNDPELDR